MNNAAEKIKETPSSDEPKATDSGFSLNNEDGVRFNKDVVIKPLGRMPHLDKGDVKAYQAVGSQKVGANLFALVCEKSLTPRISSSNKYASIINPNLARLVATGKTVWDEGVERYCFVYENTLGQPLVPREGKSIALGWKPELVMGNVIKPMINLLLDMRDKDLVHGEVWPGNMYDGGSASKDKIRLGECLTAPPSSQLPALYEPIERAMADPLGRGPGTNVDDLYAFGVSLAVMMRNEDPLEGLSDEEIVTQKIEKGSYTTLIGKERFSGAVLELLRGLLYDDKSQRWTLDEVQAWMDGRRLSPKQSPKRIKANRPITYDDKKYTRPELLAKNLNINPNLTAKLVDSGELQVWLERAIEDKTLKARMEHTMDDLAAIEKGEGYADRLSTRVAVTLSPDAPVTYKGLNFTPDGFGKYFSNTFLQRKDLQPFIEVLRGVFFLQIIRQKTDLDQAALLGKFDSCRVYIGQTKIGSGIERCLYHLDPDCPCVSDTLDDHYVRSPEEMMRALNDVAKKKDKPKRIIDRHIAAFLSVKDRKNIDPYVIDLGAEEDHRRVLAELKVLATIQKRSQLENFPDLAKWVSERLGPVYENLHDREKRKKLTQHVEKLSKVGDLTKIAFLFDDEHLYENDFYMFGQAKDKFEELLKEEHYLNNKLTTKKGFGEKTGHQIASFVSLVLSIVIISVTAFITLSS
ncbi:MAG: hypothetical protein HRT94_03440 [Alphaproteobacteria bacterium]|nr:hypothetical protein [Alphaproteobacteria bacterium]